MTTKINDHLTAKANALFAQAETLTSAELAIHTRINKMRLQGILDGSYTATMDEWDRIFAYFKVDPLAPEPIRPELMQVSDLTSVYRQFLAPCGITHRHLAIECILPEGHQGSHQGSGYEWANDQCGPTLSQRMDTFQSRFEGRLSTVEKELARLHDILARYRKALQSALG